MIVYAERQDKTSTTGGRREGQSLIYRYNRPLIDKEIKMTMIKALHGSCCMLAITWLFSSAVTTVHASVYVDTPFAEKVFDSVAYFDFKETRWPFVGEGDMLIGPTRVLTSSSFDDFFVQYQTAEFSHENSSNYTTAGPDFESRSTLTPFSSDPYNEYHLTIPPFFLIIEFGSSAYSSSLENIRRVAGWTGVDFVVLVVNRNATWQERFMFWWSRDFPGIPSRVLKNEAEIVTSNGRCSFLAMGASQGAAMIDMLKTYEEWGITSSDEFYFGIDTISVMMGRTFAIRVGLYVLMIVLFWRWTKMMERREQLERNGGEEELVKYTGEDLGMGEVQASSAQHECCVCLESMPQGENVRILPCRHVFHHECINGWFEQGKFSCPMCKMELKKHLEERRKASEELAAITAPPKTTLRQRLWPWGRTIATLNVDLLIAEQGRQQDVGDLELTVDSGVIV